MEVNDKKKKINKLKESKKTLILAHYYTNPEIQSIADYVGDSFYLCQLATIAKEETIVVCGVQFMAESLKLLCPRKKVLLADVEAKCPMAHMTIAEEIKKARRAHDDLAVVCYINSTIEIKAHSDVCVTSANARKVVGQLTEKNIFFVPDQNLGRYIASQMPEKNFFFDNGFCYVHTGISREKVLTLKSKHPNAMILAHPECTEDVLKMADYVASTSGIINYAAGLEDKEFIICTEKGILYELEKNNSNNIFYFVEPDPICQDMKRITLDKVYTSMKNQKEEVILDPAKIEKASKAINRMMELANK